MYLFVDTETTGLPKSFTAPLQEIDNWPRIVQLAWALHDDEGHSIDLKSDIIIPENFEIPEEAVKKHGITKEKALQVGIPIEHALKQLNKNIKKSSTIIAHNIDFDIPTINAEFCRSSIKTSLLEKSTFCTMKSKEIISFCKISKPYGSGYKWPSLPELHRKLYNKTFDGEHDASKDVEACAYCFFELKRRGVI
ncbi:MAG: 3'-5' exonuclease [Methanoregula sp.]|jgi:DNA polymerase III epsilon subunit-like protein|uniref:3'-5' exonuclease n=1 Tax=Methanoregula sp. TaxID=2052170 RepID=UPI0025D531A3|nr:3'-5' exonuclease [Methanoregula sp.]MCK9631038.1 3'-5' exonuclease [Methanoregula sp.]